MSVEGGPDIVTDGLVLHLDAANNRSIVSGSTIWRDLSGNGNNATLTNGPAFNSINGGSIVFDGVNDYAITPSMSLSGGLTFSLWLKGNVKDGNDHVLIDAMDVNPNNWGGEIGIMNYGNNLVYFGTNYNYNITLDASSTIMTNNWINVVVTQSSTLTSTITSYLNGIIGVQGVIAQGISSTNSVVNIGRRNDNLVFYGGSIASVQIYNRALSDKEVRQNYNATKGRFGLF